MLKQALFATLAYGAMTSHGFAAQPMRGEFQFSDSIKECWGGKKPQDFPQGGCLYFLKGSTSRYGRIHPLVRKDLSPADEFRVLARSQDGSPERVAIRLQSGAWFEVNVSYLGMGQQDRVLVKGTLDENRVLTTLDHIEVIEKGAGK